MSVRDVVNRFLTAKQQLVDSGELSPRTFRAYHETATRITAAFGLRRLVVDLATNDFETYRAGIAKAWGPVALGNEVNRVRIIFKFAFDVRLIDAPVAFGPVFKRPSRNVLRQARQAKGPRMFEAVQLRRILGKAGQPMEAMILLGINCGFGNGDVSRLPIAALDLKTGWVTYPRHKTAIERRVKLWPETVKAIKAWLTRRPKPKNEEHELQLFITKRGLSWAKETSDNPVSTEFSKLLKELKLDRPGLNFYALRHTFETVGGETADQVAVDAIIRLVATGGDALYILLLLRDAGFRFVAAQGNETDDPQYPSYESEHAFAFDGVAFEEF